MHNWHPWQLKRSKLWGPFWSCQLNILAVNRLNWLCCLASSSKTAPRILIFSIAMGGDYLFELISITHWVPKFIGHNKTFLGNLESQLEEVQMKPHCVWDSNTVDDQRFSVDYVLNIIWFALAIQQTGIVYKSTLRFLL